MKTAKKYAHDYRDMNMNEFDLEIMLVNFLKEALDEIKKELE